MTLLYIIVNGSKYIIPAPHSYLNLKEGSRIQVSSCHLNQHITSFLKKELETFYFLFYIFKYLLWEEQWFLHLCCSIYCWSRGDKLYGEEEETEVWYLWSLLLGTSENDGVSVSIVLHLQGVPKKLSSRKFLGHPVYHLEVSCQRLEMQCNI